MAKKRKKADSTQTSASAEQDIVGLITTLVQKLVTLETKIDTILNRLSQRPSEASRPYAAPAAPAAQARDTRPMYKAVCADCRKSCEVPFKPRGDRPVYCKNCFAVRKKEGAFKPWREEKPKDEPAAKPVVSAGKKKPPAKKSRKKKA